MVKYSVIDCVVIQNKMSVMRLIFFHSCSYKFIILTIFKDGEFLKFVSLWFRTKQIWAKIIYLELLRLQQKGEQVQFQVKECTQRSEKINTKYTTRYNMYISQKLSMSTMLICFEKTCFVGFILQEIKFYIVGTLYFSAACR